MVDVEGTQSFEYKFFRGLNLRDDENNLPMGQTPFAQNFEITKLTGLKKRSGFDDKFQEFDFSYSFMGASNYRPLNEDMFYVSVSYPDLYLHNRDNGFSNKIASDLTSDGEPFFISLNLGQMLMVDGANAPRLISNGVASTATWPPVYNVQNNTLLTASNNATASNPTTLGTNIGFPSFGALYENRTWLAGDKLAPYRIYVSKLLQYSEFGNNNTGTYNIAFFVDIPAESPITALKVISDKFMVIYCEREILILSGKFPPGTAYPDPKFRIDSLNPAVGCLGCKLIAEKGNNDHFFVANNGLIYNLNNTDNFQDVRPTGLSSKIYTLFQELDNDTLKRGKLINHRIKGELHFWYPSSNSLVYPDKRLVYSYSKSDQEDEWSEDTSFGEFYLRDTFIDDETNELILVTSTKFLINDSGNTYDGQNIDLIYQLSTMDFGNPDIRKEITQVTVYVSNQSADDTTALFYNLWDNNQASFTRFTIPSSLTSEYGTAEYGASKWGSFAGKSFNKVDFQISNKIGKIFKCRIRHTEEAPIFIHSIVFRYKILGK
jgi:hypothetical protein